MGPALPHKSTKAIAVHSGQSAPQARHGGRNEYCMQARRTPTWWSKQCGGAGSPRPVMERQISYWNRPAMRRGNHTCMQARRTSIWWSPCGRVRASRPSRCDMSRLGASWQPPTGVSQVCCCPFHYSLAIVHVWIMDVAQHFEHAEGFTAAARMALSYVMPLDGHEVDTHTLSRDYLMLCSAALLVPCVSCIQLGVLLAIST